MLITVLAIVMGNNDTIADTSIYLHYYNNAGAWSLVDSQWAIAIFMYVCKIIGLTYIQFRIVYFACGLSIILHVVNRYIKKCTWFVLLYFLYPMMIDAAQIKNFMAMCFLTLALVCLVQEGNRNRLLFVLWCLVAAGFQITAYAYLPSASFSIF